MKCINETSMQKAIWTIIFQANTFNGGKNAETHSLSSTVKPV